MNDPWNVKFEKSSFKSDGLRQIRWGIFDGNDGKPRIAAFLVDSFVVSMEGYRDVDFNAEAEMVIKTEETLNGPTHQTFEWVNDRFESVDPEEQDWFKFN